MPESFDHQPTDGSILIRLRKLEAEALVQFRDRRASDHGQHTRTYYFGQLLAQVVFVLDIADDLLDQILQRQNSSRAAILIDDHGPIFPAAFHRHQLLVERHRFREITDRPHHVADRAAEIGRLQKIENMNDADDVRDSTPEDRNAAESLAADSFDRSRKRGFLRDRILMELVTPT